MIACMKGHTDIVGRLTAAKADADMQNDVRIHCTSMCPWVEWFGGVLERRMWCGTMDDCCDTPVSHREDGPLLYVIFQEGWTALICAVSRAHEEAAMLCIDAGANVNKQVQVSRLH